jgi:hypothetical protein
LISLPKIPNNAPPRAGIIFLDTGTSVSVPDPKGYGVGQEEDQGYRLPKK